MPIMKEPYVQTMPPTFNHHYFYIALSPCTTMIYNPEAALQGRVDMPGTILLLNHYLVNFCLSLLDDMFVVAAYRRVRRSQGTQPR